MKPVYILISPTASGKTRVSLELAQRLNLEIVNADAYQFFEMMDIGTAKPSLEERKIVPHHLFDICKPDQIFSAHDFSKKAHQAIDNIHKKGKVPLFVGGSGFYIRALLTPQSQNPKGTKTDIEDYEKAYQTIHEKDPVLANSIHPHDHYRIQRALFLLENNIVPSQTWQEEQNQTLSFEPHLFTISMDRSLLYDRINQRVVEMFENGLLEETQNIINKYPDSLFRLTKTIGYQQCLAILNQELSLDQAIEQTKQKTRNYAKRQNTWIQNQLNPTKMHFENAFDELFCYINQTTL